MFEGVMGGDVVREYLNAAMPANVFHYRSSSLTTSLMMRPCV